MEHTDRDELRRLALWLSRRRAVDDAVSVLTAYGPAASRRVHTHLDALRVLLDAEHEAFEAICTTAPRVPQLPLPEVDVAPGPYDAGPREATVHVLGAARDRYLRT